LRGSLKRQQTIKLKNMKKIKIGLLLGMAAGVIDVIPMIMQNLTWDANISAFTMWIVVGFLIATMDLNINSIIKGILTAFLVLLPTAILIGWKEPVSLIPIAIMTTILGGLLGFLINKTLTKKTKR
jgi:hypothetical protein